MGLHDYLPSGNGHKVRLLLAQLGVPFERVEYDITAGETLTPRRLCPDSLPSHPTALSKRPVQLPLAFPPIAPQRPSRRDEHRQQPRHNGPPTRSATDGYGRTHWYKGHAHFGPF